MQKPLFFVGLKLRSTNTNLIPCVNELYAQELFQYIELYVVPGTLEKTLRAWESVGIMFMIHCPHSAHGFNLAKKNLEKSNRKMFSEVQIFAKRLAARVIVVHGGNNGSVEEAIRQLSCLQDQRILLENKPKVGMKDELCVGYTAEELQKIVDAAHLTGTVLDFGHATYAANALGKDPFKHIEEFLALKPNYFHLGDGDMAAIKDVHFNYGKGNFDLKEMISYIPVGGYVTIETPLDEKQDFKDFVADVMLLRELAGSDCV